MSQSDAVTDPEIRKAIDYASANTWGEWRDMFEHDGRIEANPILADAERFTEFCHKWRVGRTIRKGTCPALQRFLHDSAQLRVALQDDSGRKLDEFEREELRDKFGTRGGTRSLISVVSKIATFLRPERFVAWDQYARRGLNTVLKRSASARFVSYDQYLADFDRVWNSSRGDEVRVLTLSSLKQPFAAEPRFQRRVLDVYLMMKGEFKREGARSAGA